MTHELPLQVQQLEAVMPRLIERHAAGEFHYNSAKSNTVEFARSLIKQARSHADSHSNRPLSARQLYWVERLTRRALGTEQDGKKTSSRETSSSSTSSSTTQVPTAQVDVNAIVAQVLRQVPKFDPQQVTDQVLGMSELLSREIIVKALKELDARTPRKVVFEMSENGKTRTFDAGDQHCKFERLVRAATTRGPDGYALNIFLQGEASSGKTTGCRMLAKVLKRKWYFNGAISFPHEMLGFIDGAGKYHRTPFRDAYEHGGVYTFDEVDRSDAVALLAVNPHLANGVATFPDGQVVRHKDCVIICTANTWGLGADANYSGATKLDAAFLSRFPVKINWDIDPVLEAKIVTNSEWLAKVRRARETARRVGLKVAIDVRAAVAGAALIEQQGYTIDEAAEETYLAALKPDQRRQLVEA